MRLDSSHASSSPVGAPIKVGFLCTCSGGLSGDIVLAHDVYQAWVNTVNASGGIDGHPIQLIFENDQDIPGTSAQAAQTLIGDHVVAIVDDSDYDVTWSSTVESAKIPVVGSILTTEPFYTNPDFFAEGTTNDALTEAITATAKVAGANVFGTLYCEEAPQCAQSVAPLKVAAQKAGLSDVYNASIAATAPNYTAQCVAAQQAKVEALFIGDSNPVVVPAAQNCAAQGYNPIYLVEGVGYSTL